MADRWSGDCSWLWPYQACLKRVSDVFTQLGFVFGESVAVEIIDAFVAIVLGWSTLTMARKPDLITDGADLLC